MTTNPSQQEKANSLQENHASLSSTPEPETISNDVETWASAPPSTKYSSFTRGEKRLVIALVSYAAWFSTLSSFIYYPSLNSMATSLGVSIDKINLTVTSYMAVATIAPTLVGDASDVLGRRPIYLLCLSIYAISNIAIATARTYEALLGLRVLQALSISGTISVAYGVITDVATPGERGSFVSAVSFAITIAPSIGPILGGYLTYSFGWEAIFWFLAVASGLCLVLMFFLLPETSRALVGNGSIAPPRYNVLPVPVPFAKGFLQHYPQSSTTHDAAPKTSKRVMPNPLRSLKILVRKDNLVVIMACGLMYVVYTCINTSLSTLFISIYHLNQGQAGLIYLPFGIGGTVSTLFSGPLMDRAYRKARARRGLTIDKLAGDDLDGFPIEKARLGVIWMPLAVTVVAVAGFGWVVEFKQHIAIPLVFQFIAGLCMQLEFSIYNTLLVDKNHRNPAAAQASSNIIRCTLAAIVVAFLQNIIDALGIGWTFTFMAGLCLLIIGLFLIDYYKGTAWRQSYLPDRSSEVIMDS